MPKYKWNPFDSHLDVDEDGVSTIPSRIQDGDNDTYVEVEETADDDIIRFSSRGQEIATFRTTAEPGYYFQIGDDPTTGNFGMLIDETGNFGSLGYNTLFASFERIYLGDIAGNSQSNAILIQNDLVEPLINIHTDLLNMRNSAGDSYFIFNNSTPQMRIGDATTGPVITMDDLRLSILDSQSSSVPYFTLFNDTVTCGNEDLHHHDTNPNYIRFVNGDPSAPSELNLSTYNLPFSSGEVTAIGNGLTQHQLYRLPDGTLKTINDDGATPDYSTRNKQCLSFALSDENTPLATGQRLSIRCPYAFEVTDIKASVNGAPVGADVEIEVSVDGTSLLDVTTPLIIPDGSLTSSASATTLLYNFNLIEDDSLILFNINQIGSTTAGSGLKVYIIGYDA